MIDVGTAQSTGGADRQSRGPKRPALAAVLQALRTMALPAGICLMIAACAPQGGPPSANENDNDGGGAPSEITEDTTFASLTIPEDQTTIVRNNAVVTVTGNAVIDGTLVSANARLILNVEGDLTVNGMLSSQFAATPDTTEDQPLGEQDAGLFIIVGDGAVTIDQDAVLVSRGSLVITDDASLLDRTPQALSEEMLDLEADDLPTLIPLPEETAPATTLNFRAGKPYAQQNGAQLPPVTIRGVWPPPGIVVPGDRPVIIFRFTGARDLNLDGWTYNGPSAPNADDTDASDDAGNDASGQSGKKGGNLHIRNEGGAVRILNQVTLSLSAGGRGGSATAVCASATGGPGGEPGNLRITAAGGIDLTQGSLLIVPGRGGDGGEATVEDDPIIRVACPGNDGEDATATGGDGARNVKALFARGNVTGIENVTIDSVIGGNGGAATATGCPGDDGEECCDAGFGGSAEATGGRGGDASVNLNGLPATAVGATGGDGGQATATGGDGGLGGECKFHDAGDGGDGGDADATGGAGGAALNGGGGAAQGGDGGQATATGGDAGTGGDSGLGDPGLGGFEGFGDATGGAGGGGAPAGADGQEDEEDGLEGEDGDPLEVFFYCFGFAFVAATDGVIAPGTQEGPLFDFEAETQIGTMSMEFRDVAGAEYFKSSNPTDHIGIADGEVDFEVSTVDLDQGNPGEVGGLRVVTLYGQGLGENNPLVVQAIGEDGGVIDEQAFASVPDNQDNLEDPEDFDVVFNTPQTIIAFRVIVPEGAFVTIIRVYIIDP